MKEYKEIEFIRKKSREDNMEELMDLDQHKKAGRAEQEHNETD